MVKSWGAHVLSPFGESSPKLVPAVPSLEPGAEIFVTATSLPSLLFLPLLFQTEPGCSEGHIHRTPHVPSP